MRTQLLPRIILSSAAIAALALSGCASAGTGGSDDEAASDTGLVQVVASTNVYGDIASKVGGEFVEVTSIVTSAAQDPHSYEATAQDQLALSEADLVVENGGGYDPFVDTMLDASGGADVVVVNASESSGLMEGGAAGDAEGEAHSEEEGEAHAEEEGEEHAEGEEAHDHIEGFNEHVWYSFEGVDRVAEEIAHELGEIDQTNAAAYEDNYQAFAAEIATLEERAHGMEGQTSGLSAAITEPVPVYLLGEVGLANATPEEFSEAIEEGTDVAPAVLQETLGIFADGTVALLAYNEQTAGPETEQVREAAESAGVPVVSLTETLPEGDGYIEWMTANLDAIESAIA